MDFILWVVIAVALSVLEIVLAGFFMLFFGLGAAVTAVVAIFNPDLTLQLSVFLISSLIFLFMGRPLLNKWFKVSDRPPVASNVSKLKGETVLVIEPVNRYGGRVRVVNSGETWTAYLKEGTETAELAVDQEGVIEAIDGAKLVISPRTV